MQETGLAIKPCPDCGDPNAYVDDWDNWRTRETEQFVRCPACKKPGPSADTYEGAISEWNGL